MLPPVVSASLAFVGWLFRPCISRHLEHLALRHQLAVYQHTVHRPRLSPTDHLFWAWLSSLWPGWEDALAFVRPRTVIEQVLIAPQRPWQNAYVEREIASIRRDLLDHVLDLNGQHLRRLLTDDLASYHRSCAHLSLGRDCRQPRPVDQPEDGQEVEVPGVGALHHDERRAA